MRRIFFLLSLLLLTFSGQANSLLAAYEVFVEGNKKGLKAESGEVLIPAKYDEIGWSKGDFEIYDGAIGYKKGEAWGLITIDNEIISAPKYSQLYYGGRQLLIAGVKNQTIGGDKLGVIDLKGNQLIELKYTIVNIAGLRVIVAKKTSTEYNYGLLDLKGKLIIPLEKTFIAHLGSLRYAVTSNDGSVSIFNSDGEPISDTNLDSISAFRNGYALIYKDLKVGLIKKNGDLVLKPHFADIKNNSDGIYTRKVNTWQLLTAENENKGSVEADEISLFNQTYYKAKVGKSLWLANLQDSTESKAYDFIGEISNGMAPVKLAGKWGLINENGKEKIPIKHDSLVIRDELIFVENQSQWSIYDSFNIKKTRAKYSEIKKRSQGLFPVRKNQHWGFVNRTGEEIIHCVYDNVGNFSFNLVDVKFHGEVGVINKEGDWVVLPRKVDSIKIINKQYYITYKNSLKKLTSFQEGELIYFTENAIDIHEGYLLEYTSDGGIWKIDFNGRIISGSNNKDEYEEIRPPSEGFYAIKKDGAYGFIDNQNRLRIANQYQGVGDFHHGLASFKLLNKWGFLDKREQIVIQPNYQKVSQFYGQYAIACNESGCGLIDVEGEEVSSFSYDSIIHQDNGRYKVYRGDKVGLVSETGKSMINAKYDNLEEVKDGYAIITKGGKSGLVNKHGVNTIPMIYDRLVYDEHNDLFLAQKKSPYQKAEL